MTDNFEGKLKYLQRPVKCISVELEFSELSTVLVSQCEQRTKYLSGPEATVLANYREHALPNKSICHPAARPHSRLFAVTTHPSFIGGLQPPHGSGIDSRQSSYF